MSEIKGSLLGIILTIAVFGVVLATIGGVFQTVSDTIGERMSTAAETTLVVDANPSGN